jgi:hypothetical protein
MIRKPLDLPPAVASGFLEDMEHLFRCDRPIN